MFSRNHARASARSAANTPVVDDPVVLAAPSSMLRAGSPMASSTSTPRLATCAPTSVCPSTDSAPSSRISPSTAMVRAPRRAPIVASASTAACIDAGLAL